MSCCFDDMTPDDYHEHHDHDGIAAGLKPRWLRAARRGCAFPACFIGPAVLREARTTMPETSYMTSARLGMCPQDYALTVFKCCINKNILHAAPGASL